jgi:putative ATP-dependent endonuclease of the OLD family
MLSQIVIKNYRTFRDFKLEFDPEMNILVGDNDAGKSTILEAIGLALTYRLRGRPLNQELSPYLFNQKAVEEYISALRAGSPAEPPEIIIDLFFNKDASADLAGTNNLLKVDAPGVRIRIALNRDYLQEYNEFIGDPYQVNLVPTEYYEAEWLTFADGKITARSIPAKASLIDAPNIHLQSGVDYYLNSIIDSNLTPAEKVSLARTYRNLREKFSGSDAIRKINDKLAGSQREVSDRELRLGMDVSQKSRWETSIVPHLDELPYQFVGKGEQSSLKILLALNKDMGDAHVVLIEEPENHLAFTNLGKLVSKISETCQGKQVFITTHSSFVLNKLGLSKLVLMSPTDGFRFDSLSSDTQDYFQKLSGYDTLRLVLSPRSILVEGPSDELVMQRAYMDAHNGRLPQEDGVDIIDARGLTFARWLDIATLLKRNHVTVARDNDGKEAEVRARYEQYSNFPNISINVGEDSNYKTLEPQIIRANSLQLLNQVFGKNYATEDELLKYMTDNKTAYALAILTSAIKIVMPGYIQDAVA